MKKLWVEEDSEREEKGETKEIKRERGWASHTLQLFSISVYGTMPEYAYHVPWAATEFISDIFIAAKKATNEADLRVCTVYTMYEYRKKLKSARSRIEFEVMSNSEDHVLSLAYAIWPPVHCLADWN